MSRITPQEARDRDMVIDDCTYPWFAYKGPRFAPTDWELCFTHDEAALLEELRQLTAAMKADMPAFSARQWPEWTSAVNVIHRMEG